MSEKLIWFLSWLMLVSTDILKKNVMRFFSNIAQLVASGLKIKFVYRKIVSDIKTYVYVWGVSVLCNKTVKKGFLMSYSMQNKACNILFMHACIYFCLFIYLCACCRSMLNFNLIFSCCKWKIEPIKGLLRVKGLSSPLLFFFFYPVSITYWSCMYTINEFCLL